MFYIIGLGLSDEKDVTLRGLEVLIIPFKFISNERFIHNRPSRIRRVYTSRHIRVF